MDKLWKNGAANSVKKKLELIDLSAMNSMKGWQNLDYSNKMVVLNIVGGWPHCMAWGSRRTADYFLAGNLEIDR